MHAEGQLGEMTQEIIKAPEEPDFAHDQGSADMTAKSHNSEDTWRKSAV